jgi:hypothetical protein
MLIPEIYQNSMDQLKLKLLISSTSLGASMPEDVN